MRRRDALLVTSPENVTYLIGFESPGRTWFQGLLIPVAGEPICVSRAVGCTETTRVTASGAEALTSGVTRELIEA